MMSQDCQDSGLKYAFNFRDDVMNGSMTQEEVLKFFKNLVKDDKLQIIVLKKKIDCRALVKGEFEKESLGQLLTMDQLDTVPNGKNILVMFPKEKDTPMTDVVWVMQGVNKLGLFSYDRKSGDNIFFVEQRDGPSWICINFEVQHYSGVGEGKKDDCNKRRQVLSKLSKALSRLSKKYLPSYLDAAVSINRALGLTSIGQNVSEFLLLLQN